MSQHDWCYTVYTSGNNTSNLNWGLCVCRWVKWTSMVKCCVYSLTSCGLFTCHWTAKVTCWSLTAGIIAFYCWAVNYNYNVSSLTETLKSSCGGQHDYVTTNSQHNSTLHTAAVSSRHLMPSQCFVCDCNSLLLAMLTLASELNVADTFNTDRLTAFTARFSVIISSRNPLIHVTHH